MLNDTCVPHVLIVFNDDSDCLFVSDDDEPPSLEANQDVIEVAEAIEDALSSRGYPCSRLALRDDCAPLLQALHTLRHDAPVVVFNLVESLGGDCRRERDVPALLARHDVPFTGNAASCLELALDKGRTRQQLARHGASVARGFVVRGELGPRHIEQARHIGFPLFVKPSCSDASIGISQQSVVRDLAELRQQVAHLRAVGDGTALVEEYLSGPELNVSLWRGEHGAWECATTMIDFSCFSDTLHPIVSYDCKWTPESEEYQARSRPATELLDLATIARAEQLARRAAQALGVSGYTRVDMRLRADGTPCVIDVNTNPDLHPDAGFALAARSASLDYPTLIAQLVRNAHEVHADVARTPSPLLRRARGARLPAALYP